MGEQTAVAAKNKRNDVHYIFKKKTPRRLKRIIYKKGEKYKKEEKNSFIISARVKKN